MSIQTVSQIIRSRRAYFPKTYSSRPIDPSIIEEVIENANWAPTHKRTEPWRYRIFHSLSSRQRLANAIAKAFKEFVPPEAYTEAKAQDHAEKALLSGCVMAIIMHRDEKAGLPEWEEIASTAMSVQNMWLTCASYEIGSYWATAGFIFKLGDILELKESERCLGLFYMGYVQEGTFAPALRNPIADKIKWMQ